jgi:hypothetical protein
MTLDGKGKFLSRMIRLRIAQNVFAIGSLKQAHPVGMAR